MKVIGVKVGAEFYSAKYDGKHLHSALTALKEYIEQKQSPLIKANRDFNTLGSLVLGGSVFEAAIDAAWAERQRILDTFISQTTNMEIEDLYVDYDVRGNSISSVRHGGCRVKVK